MSFKMEVIKTAINIAISLKFPEMVILQHIVSGTASYLADEFDEMVKRDEQSIEYRIDHLYSEVFSKSNLKKSGIEYEKRSYYEDYLKKVLKSTPLELKLLVKYKNSPDALCRFMIESYPYEEMPLAIEEKKQMLGLLCQLLPEMIRIVSSNTEWLLDLILQLFQKIENSEDKIHELKNELSELRREMIGLKKTIMTLKSVSNEYSENRYPLLQEQEWNPIIVESYQLRPIFWESIYNELSSETITYWQLKRLLDEWADYLQIPYPSTGSRENLNDYLKSVIEKYCKDVWIFPDDAVEKCLKTILELKIMNAQMMIELL